MRVTARPAIAGRERLAQALGQSVLVQLMLAMSFVALAALLYMAQASQVSVQQINISELQSDRVQLTSDNASLRATTTDLQSLPRIDAVATSRLHMTKPDLSTAIWVSPVVPRVPVPHTAGGDVAAAQRQSEPLTWLEHFVSMIQASL